MARRHESRAGGQPTPAGRRAAFMAAIALLLSGCMATDKSDGPSKAVRMIDLSAFVGDSEKAVHDSNSSDAVGSHEQPTVVEVDQGSAVSTAGDDTEPTVSADSRVPDVPITHDGLIGQVNGRAIYADDILKPIEDKLRILGSTEDYSTFVLEADREIQQKLSERVRYELIYAEAEASLSENERVGLFHFLRKLERDMTRNSSRRAEDTRLRKETGLSIDEAIEVERVRQLVLFKVQSEIRSKVVVTWRDIERYYRKNYDQFNPPAAIQLRVLGVDARDTVTQAAVAEELEQGYEFEAVASQYSKVLASRGGLLPVMPLDKGLAQTPLTSWPEVDAAVRTVKQGECCGPVQAGDLLLWAYVESYSDGVGRTLYEVQHEIEDQLFNMRFREEEQKYVEQLIARGNMDDFDQMKLQVLRIAVDRWAPEGP